MQLTVFAIARPSDYRPALLSYKDDDGAQVHLPMVVSATTHEAAITGKQYTRHTAAVNAAWSIFIAVANNRPIRRHYLKNSSLKQWREYRIWQNMIQRCTNPKATSYADYGGRGITVCKEWRADFLVFFRDMGMAPSALHSIDRVDVNGPYSNRNCRWATPKEQAANTRRTKGNQ